MLDGSDAVAEPADGFHAGRAELPAEAGNENFDSVGVAVEVLGVDVIDQFNAGDDAVAVVQQVREDAELETGELDRFAGEGDAGGADVKGERTGVEFDGRGSAGAPDERADAGKHLFHAEWLGDVVVGAAVDALHFFVPATAGGEDQDRPAKARGAPAAEKRQSVDLGEPEIEQHDIVLAGVRQVVSLSSVGGRVHGVAGLGQLLGQSPGDQRFVLDNQNSQSPCYNPGR